jgi:DNA repair exonuclease SbcCD ATPase subunit
MKGKIIKFQILGVLAIASFVASYFVTKHFTATPPEGLLLSTEDEKIPVDPDALLLNSMAQATGNQMTPKERQLDELIREVRAKIKDLERRERRLNEREKRLATASDQLKSQIKKLTDLKVELATAIGPLRAARQDIRRYRVLITSQEVANIAAAAKMWEKMEPSNAARLMVEMWQTKQGPAATKIFHMLSDKSKAAVMDELKGERLGPEIIRQQLLVIREDKTL